MTNEEEQPNSEHDSPDGLFPNPVMSRVVALSAGNPGAATVLVALAKDLGSLPIPGGFLLALDIMEKANFRGPDIWIQYKDVNKGNIMGFTNFVMFILLDRITKAEEGKEAVETIPN